MSPAIESSFVSIQIAHTPQVRKSPLPYTARSTQPRSAIATSISMFLYASGAAFPFSPRATELRLLDTATGFHGQFDILCRLRGDTALSLWDYKTPESAAGGVSGGRKICLRVCLFTAGNSGVSPYCRHGKHSRQNGIHHHCHFRWFHNDTSCHYPPGGGFLRINLSHRRGVEDSL